MKTPPKRIPKGAQRAAQSLKESSSPPRPKMKGSPPELAIAAPRVSASGTSSEPPEAQNRQHQEFRCRKLSEKVKICRNHLKNHTKKMTFLHSLATSQPVNLLQSSISCLGSATAVREHQVVNLLGTTRRGLHFRMTCHEIWLQICKKVPMARRSCCCKPLSWSKKSLEPRS